MRLHVLNLSHDLALANNSPNYMAQASVAKMEYDLATLPRSYAEEGDEVLLSSETSLEDFAGEVAPWGWNEQLVARLQKQGLRASCLPTHAQLAEIRRLSNRQTSIELLHHLQASWPAELPPFCGEALYIDNEQTLREVLLRGGATVIKAPLSGSGRGLRFGEGTYQAPLKGWCRNVLRTQGGIVVEPRYQRLRDFALEFFADRRSGRVHYLGLSCFRTSLSGAYIGSLVASDEGLLRQLSPHISEGQLHALATLCSDWLTTRLSGRYGGCIGVDMMLATLPQSAVVHLHPCVEVNLRRTMGEVALHLRRLVPEGRQGCFYIDYAAKGKALKGEGSALTPIDGDTLYCAKLKLLNT